PAGSSDAAVLVPAGTIPPSGLVAERVETLGCGDRRMLIERTLLSADLAALLLAYSAAALFDSGLRTRMSLILFALALPLWVLATRFCGLHDRDDRRPGHSTLDELLPLAQLLTAGVW